MWPQLIKLDVASGTCRIFTRPSSAGCKYKNERNDKITLLHIASINGQPGGSCSGASQDVARVLVERGADANALDIMHQRKDVRSLRFSNSKSI